MHRVDANEKWILPISEDTPKSQVVKGISSGFGDRSFSRKGDILRFVVTLLFAGFTFVAAGCQHDRNYSASCPHCQQVHAAMESHPAAATGQVSGNTVQPATFAPVPPVPVAED